MSRTTTPGAGPNKARHRTFATFRAGVSPERVREYRQALQERLGLNVEVLPRKRLDSMEVARLAGVMPGTITQWKRRTRLDQTLFPFLDPAPESYPEKDVYDPLDVCYWLDWADKWPPGAAGREDTRGPRLEQASRA